MISSHGMGLSYTDRIMRKGNYIYVSQQLLTDTVTKPTSTVIAVIVNLQLVNISEQMHFLYLS